MKFLLLGTLGIPLFSLILMIIFQSKSEKLISRLASFTKIALSLCTLGVLVGWFHRRFDPLEFTIGNLYRGVGYRFDLIFYFDRVSAVFLAMITFISAVIIRFCRYYLHREPGYCRFFATIMLFIFGMNLLVISGTLDLLFASWEIIGISSFLLIAFYRERILPVNNALRAYSVFRLSGLGLLLGIWVMHLIWNESLPFSRFSSLVVEFGGNGSPNFPILVLSLLLLFAAAGKSAQFPFCFWLPRAMEGPTPSSAIFYGALSVHAGVFLLLRTYPLWHTIVSARLAVGLLGALSALFASLCGRTQSNIKGHIAYSSIAQVGIMFIELAIGFPTLVLFHFVANTCLRSYQLLVSPSVVAHLLRVQKNATTGFRIADWSVERVLPVRWRSSLYALAVNEGYFEAMFRAIFWSPLIRLGSQIRKIDRPEVRLGVFFLALVMAIGGINEIGFFSNLWPMGIAFLAGLATLSAIVENRSAAKAWNTVAFSALLSGVLVSTAVPQARSDSQLYFLGLLPAWLLGLWVLKHKGGPGHGPEKGNDKHSSLFFVAFLGLSGFPITSAFLGVDVLFEYSSGQNWWFAPVIGLMFVLNGVTLARLYSRVCFGAAGKIFAN